MKKSILTITALALGVILLSYGLGSCSKDDNPNHLTRLAQEIPEGFPDPAYRFADNPLSREGFELGKKLFYDGRLSIDNIHSCASCHQQIAAFGTYEHDRSHGVNGTHTLRNAPPLFNLAWQTRFHWDGEFGSLHDEAAHPIHGQNEMGETFQGIVTKLQRDDEYRRQFKTVFRTEFISPELILKALAQFTGFMVSANSKYDRYKNGAASFSAREESGYQLYKAKCATCHPEPMFTDYRFHNTGLPVDPLLNDHGRMLVSKQSSDSLLFRTPSLRNTYITSNYMHDGRFNTLAQCLNHYRSGVQPGPTLDPLLTGGGIPLTDAEADNLELFLRTLTDSSFIKDPRFTGN
ncbi:MAG: cytochrome c peroxidase [Chitinophagaceae bacterium]